MRLGATEFVHLQALLNVTQGPLRFISLLGRVILWASILGSDCLLPRAARAQQRPATVQWTAQVTPFGDKESEHHQFSNIAGLATDPSGRLYVSDGLEHVVKVFEASGRWIATIGRRGEGPGDLNQPGPLGIDASGRLWVLERVNRRWSLFRWVEGKLVFERTTESPGRARDFGMKSVVWDGRGDPILYALSEGSNPAAFKPTTRTLGSDGRIAQAELPTLAGPAFESLFLTRQESSSGRAVTIRVSQPFGSAPLGAIGPGGSWASANSGLYHVVLYPAGTREPVHIRSSIPPVPVPQAEATREKLRLDTLERQFRQRIPFRVPKYKPPLSEVSFDWDGRLWVFLQPSEGFVPRAADIYDQSGKLIARAVWPEQLEVHRFAAVSGTAGYALQRDADGGRSIVRVRWVPSR